MARRILIVAPPLSAGGLETHLAGQCRELEGLGWGVMLHAPNLPAGLAFAGRQIAASAGFDLPPRRFAEGSKELAAKAEGAELVYSHNLQAGLVGACVAHVLGVPHVVAVHGPYEAGRIIGPWWRIAIEGLILPSASTVAAVSEETAAVLEERGAKHLSLIRNGVGPTFSDARQTEGDSGRWLLVSRLAPNKSEGIAQLLREMPTVPGFAVDVVGHGPGLQSLADLATSLGLGDRVRFLGLRHDVSALMAQAVGVIGMGRVLLEGGALGKPTILLGYDGVKAAVNVAALPEMARANYSGRNLPAGTLESAWGSAALSRGELESVRGWIRRNADEHQIWAGAADAWRMLRARPWPMIGALLDVCGGADPSLRRQLAYNFDLMWEVLKATPDTEGRELLAAAMERWAEARRQAASASK